MRRITLFTIIAVLFLGTPVVWGASGYLLVPDHHAGLLGDNDIPVTATGLEGGNDYSIKLQVFYHENPRTPPEEGASPPLGYTETFGFYSEDGSDVSKTFIVPLPDCHWQISACFTLYYWNGVHWLWNGDERSSECVDIWADCNGDEDQPGTGTPGYWKTHPEAWPVDEITLGGITYTKDEAISYMWMPEKGDKTFTIFRALVSAKLNVLIGNDSSCIDDTIAAADAWLETFGPVGSSVKGNSIAWEEGEPLYFDLDDYNNGLLCAPSRDIFDE